MRLYVGELVTPSFCDNRTWLMPHLQIEHFAYEYNSRLKALYDSGDGEPCYVYGSDGNTQIISDPYNHSLVALPLADIINAVAQDYGPSHWTGVDHWILSILEAVRDSFPEEELYVAIYGY